MSWEFKSKPLVFVEGDNGDFKTIEVSVAWTGTVERNLSKITLALQTEHITTSGTVDAGLGTDGFTKDHAILREDDDGVFRGSFKVTVRGDDLEEGNEAFAIHAYQSTWYQKNENGYAETRGETAVENERLYAFILDDDGPGTGETLEDTINALHQQGKIDDTGRNSLVEQVEQAVENVLSKTDTPIVNDTSPPKDPVDPTQEEQVDRDVPPIEPVRKWYYVEGGEELPSTIDDQFVFNKTATPLGTDIGSLAETEFQAIDAPANTAMFPVLQTDQGLSLDGLSGNPNLPMQWSDQFVDVAEFVQPVDFLLG